MCRSLHLPLHRCCMCTAAVIATADLLASAQAEEERARVKAEEDAKEKIATAEVPPSAPADTPDTAGHGALSGQVCPAANGSVSAVGSAEWTHAVMTCQDLTLRTCVMPSTPRHYLCLVGRRRAEWQGNTQGASSQAL